MFHKLLEKDLDAKFKASLEYANYRRYAELYEVIKKAIAAKRKGVVELANELDLIYRHDQDDFRNESIAINVGELSKEEAEQFAFALYIKNVCCNGMTVAFKAMLRLRAKDSVKQLFDILVENRANAATQSSETKTKEWQIIEDVLAASEKYLKHAGDAEAKFNVSIYARVPTHFSEKASLKLQRLRAQKALGSIVNAKKYEERLTQVNKLVFSTEGTRFLTSLEKAQQDIYTLLAKVLREAESFFGTNQKGQNNRLRQ